MSLINKMLQDLDARGNARTEGMPADIKPVPRPEDGLRRLPLRRIAAVTAALLAVALGVTAWGLLPIKGKTYDTPPTPPATQRANPAPATPEPASVTVAEVASAPAAPGGAASAARQAPAAQPSAATPEAQADTAAATAAPATTSAAAPARRALPQAAPAAASGAAGTNTNAAAAAVAAETSWAVANARFQAEQARLAARWRAEETRLAALPPAERGAAEQRLREEKARAALRAKADAAWLAALQRKEADAGVESTRAAPGEQGRTDLGQGVDRGAGQGAEAAYRRALASLQEGRVSEAIAGLQAALRISPKHDAARQTLVGLLVEQNRGDEAMGQLQQALTLDPRQPALAMLLARLQIERGKSGIDTLLRTLPYAAGKGDYAAFLAGALQRQGRYVEAAAQYQAALRTAPANAVWWMGLGISLQANKRNAEALDAFRQARALGTLSPDLQTFVERKIEQLAR